MTIKYHVNDKGEPGKCSAKNGKCPFGGDDKHFSSIVEARTNFEKQQPTLTSALSKGYSLSELNSLVKSSSDQDIWEAGLNSGSPRVLANLASNHYITSEYLEKVFDKAVEKNETGVLKHVLLNSKFPVSKLREEDIQLLSGQWGVGSVMASISSSDDLGDIHVKALAKYIKQNVPFALRNPNNKISAKVFNELANQDNYFRSAALLDPRFDVEKGLKTANDSEIGILAQRSINKKTLEHVFASARKSSDISRKRRIYEAFTYNTNTPSEILEKIADDPDTHLYAIGFVAMHPNSGKSTLDKIQSMGGTAGAAVTVRRKNEEDPGFIQGLYAKPIASEAPNYSSQKRSVYFDAEKVREAGWGKDEIDAVVRRVNGNWLFDSKYDSTTGIYSGFID